MVCHLEILAWTLLCIFRAVSVIIVFSGCWRWCALYDSCCAKYLDLTKVCLCHFFFSLSRLFILFNSTLKSIKFPIVFIQMWHPEQCSCTLENIVEVENTENHTLSTHIMQTVMCIFTMTHHSQACSIPTYLYIHIMYVYRWIALQYHTKSDAKRL